MDRIDSRSIPTLGGIITGRNGTYDIAAVEVCTMGDTLIRIDGRGKSGIVINGGLSFDRYAARELGKFLVEVTKED